MFSVLCDLRDNNYFHQLVKDNARKVTGEETDIASELRVDMQVKIDSYLSVTYQ
jgi:hypothetical protein